MFSRKVSNPSSKSATESSSHSSTPTSTPSLEGPSTPTFEKSGTASSVQTPSSVSFVSGMTESTATASGYSRKQALDDLPMIRNVLHTFLSGKMVEAEAQIKDADLNNERLYTTSGWGVIQCLKSLMSFEEDEIDAALEATKHAAFVAGHHRRPATSLTARLAGLVVGSAQTSGVGFVKGMTAVERHAELVYAECLLEKAILGIASSGDWLTFIKEFLNIRSATNIYRTLGQFIQTMDAEAVARGEGPIDRSIDLDFRSGVALGNGVNSLVLTMLPDSVSGVVALFGYKGDRIDGLRTLSAPGGWQDGITDPSITQENEGLRRPITDLMLLVFHLYLSAVTYLGVSIPQARNILNYNLKLYPDGVFFLFLQGRLRIIESQPELAIESFTKGMQLTQYETLKNVAIWEMAVAKLTLCDWSPDLWKRLLDESNWSKVMFDYFIF
ncbi:hypothetical protein FRC03_002161 [Tulasnella sp. 419]|nr:hypothetical protein FRC03_002161 [Tulasnella sp. 419]